MASFFWKPARFEIRNYSGGGHRVKIEFVEKYTLNSWYLAILEVFKY